MTKNSRYRKDQKARHAKCKNTNKGNKDQRRRCCVVVVAEVYEVYSVYGKDGPDGSLDKAG